MRYREGSHVEPGIYIDIGVTRRAPPLAPIRPPSDRSHVEPLPWLPSEPPGTTSGINAIMGSHQEIDSMYGNSRCERVFTCPTV